MLVCRSTEQEHDEGFVEMVKATRKHNVNLNSDKLQFKSNGGQFLWAHPHREGHSTSCRQTGKYPKHEQSFIWQGASDHTKNGDIPEFNTLQS